MTEQLAYFPSQHRLSVLHNTSVCTIFPLRCAIIKTFVSHLASIKIWTVYSRRWCALTRERNKDDCWFSSNHQLLCKQVGGQSGGKMKHEYCFSSWRPGANQSPTKQWVAETGKPAAESPAIHFLEYPPLPVRSPWMGEAQFMGILHNDKISSSSSHFSIFKAQEKHICSFQLTLC